MTYHGNEATQMDTYIHPTHTTHLIYLATWAQEQEKLKTSRSLDCYEGSRHVHQ